jgi:hypothetical protein
MYEFHRSSHSLGNAVNNARGQNESPPSPILYNFYTVDILDVIKKEGELTVVRHTFPRDFARSFADDTTLAVSTSFLKIRLTS